MSGPDIDNRKMNSAENQLFILLLKIYCHPDMSGICEWKGLEVPAFEGRVCFEVLSMVSKKKKVEL